MLHLKTETDAIVEIARTNSFQLIHKSAMRHVAAIPMNSVVALGA